MPALRDRSERLGPLTGVLFVVLVLVGGPVLEGSTPGAHAGGAHVIAFYAAHRGKERAGAILLVFAFVAFLFFASALRSAWRRRTGAEGSSAALLAGATLLAAGQTIGAGLVYALTAAPKQLSLSTAQTLNLLHNDLVLTSAAGFLVFGFAATMAILRGDVLPRWLGWGALVIGVLFVTPAEFLGFLLLVVWVLVVSVLLVRTPHPPVADAAPQRG